MINDQRALERTCSKCGTKMGSNHYNRRKYTLCSLCYPVVRKRGPEELKQYLRVS